MHAAKLIQFVMYLVENQRLVVIRGVIFDDVVYWEQIPSWEYCSWKGALEWTRHHLTALHAQRVDDLNTIEINHNTTTGTARDILHFVRL